MVYSHGDQQYGPQLTFLPFFITLKNQKVYRRLKMGESNRALTVSILEHTEKRNFQASKWELISSSGRFGKLDAEQGILSPPEESVKLICEELCYNLKVQYDSIKNDFDRDRIWKINFIKERCATRILSSNFLQVE